MSRSIELNLCPSQSYPCIMVEDVLEGSLKFKVLQRHFLKALNNLLTFPKTKNEYSTLVLMISGKSVPADSISNIFRLLQGTIT